MKSESPALFVRVITLVARDWKSGDMREIVVLHFMQLQRRICTGADQSLCKLKKTERYNHLALYISAGLG